MIQVDARGLSCPEPLLRTKEVLDEYPNEVVQTIVSDVNARENVKNLGLRRRKDVEVKQEGQDFYITINSHPKRRIMRKRKEERLVVSFHTTTDAVAMRALGKSAGLRGRMIPVPRQISAGCGLAWSEPADNADALYRAIESHTLEYEAITPLEL